MSRAVLSILAALAILACESGGSPPAPPPGDDDAFRAHWSEARSLYSEGRLREALGQAARALQAAPASRDPYGLVMQIYIELGEDEEAVRFFEGAARSFHGTPLPWYGKGYHEFRLYRWNDANASFRKAIEIDPNDSESRYRLAVTLHAMGRFDESVEQLEIAHRLSPRNAAIAARYSRALRISGRYAEAERVVRAALSAAPASSDLHYALGQLRLREGNLEAAESELRRAIALDPLHREAHLDLARLLSRSGREEDGRLHELEADAISTATEERDGQRRRLAESPDDPIAVLALAEIELSLGDLEEATRWLERAARLGAPGGAVAAGLAEARFRAGKIEEGRNALGRLPTSGEPRDLLARAWASIAEGRRDEAAGLLDEAVASAPGDASLLRRLAAAYERAGRTGDAVSLLERAKRVY